MATGAGDEYWKEQALPSVFKHALLDKYMPQFAGMTGSAARGRRVVYLDGYAGRGRYEDGTRASVERILTIAQNQHRNAGLGWTCFFVEQDDESAAVLLQVTAEYAAAGVTVFAHHGAVVEVLDDVIAAAAGVPLFLFLDPCGLGVPYRQLTGLLSAERSQTWPPTEILLNFSLEAVRRIGGHVTSPKGNETTMARLDAMVGGPWWRQRFAAGVTDEAVIAVVQEFCSRFGADTGMMITAVPVRRAPTHKPIYHLVFGPVAHMGSGYSATAPPVQLRPGGIHARRSRRTRIRTPYSPLPPPCARRSTRSRRSRSAESRKTWPRFWPSAATSRSSITPSLCSASTTARSAISLCGRLCRSCISKVEPHLMVEAAALVSCGSPGPPRRN